MTVWLFLNCTDYGMVSTKRRNMFEIKGKYTTAKVFSDTRDEKAIEQIAELCSQPFVKDCKVRIMPDYHWGAGCTIGFTANLGQIVVPNLTGVDIGCGICMIELGRIKKLDLPGLDAIIHKNIPSGFSSHVAPVTQMEEINNLHCFHELNIGGKNRTKNPVSLFQRQIGTLGGGNHFIEIDMDADENCYLLIHSGSRNMGKQIADHYQRKAIEYCSSAAAGTPKALCYLTGIQRDRYLHDMEICQRYASTNRLMMAQIILNHWLECEISAFNYFQTIHNYINTWDGIIRKGAVSARQGERLIIPMNMRDGSLICVGKGNPDWNWSAPHGAGRLMGRKEAERSLNIKDFRSSMDGIYSTTVNIHTLDEAPQAYKPMEEIIRNIHDSVQIEKIIKPVYNFKAGKEF